jgi:hypothetical protein
VIDITDNSEIYPLLALAEKIALENNLNDQFKSHYEELRQSHGIKMSAILAIQKIGLLELMEKQFTIQRTVDSI